MNKIKYKFIIGVLFIGAAVIIFGTLQKIMHTANANTILKTGYGIVVATVLLAALKIMFNRKDDFLNK